jgi:cytochrome c-type biogenesis protein CcmF
VAGGLALAVAVGADQWASLVALALGGSAAGAAFAPTGAGDAPARVARGLVGRANGGMIVHLGVIIVAVALAASNGYTRGWAGSPVRRGEPVSFDGHTFELREHHLVHHVALRQGVKAQVSIDGGQACSAGDHPLTRTWVPTSARPV